MSDSAPISGSDPPLLLRIVLKYGLHLKLLIIDGDRITYMKTANDFRLQVVGDYNPILGKSAIEINIDSLGPDGSCGLTRAGPSVRMQTGAPFPRSLQATRQATSLSFYLEEISHHSRRKKYNRKTCKCP